VSKKKKKTKKIKKKKEERKQSCSDNQLEHSSKHSFFSCFGGTEV
jgi:hypothetical protein